MTVFKYENESYKTVKVKKVDEKMGHLSSFLVPCLVIVDKLFKKVHFWQFCAELSKKFSSVKAVHICISESFYCILSENDVVYMGASYRS